MKLRRPRRSATSTSHCTSALNSDQQIADIPRTSTSTGSLSFKFHMNFKFEKRPDVRWFSFGFEPVDDGMLYDALVEIARTPGTVPNVHADGRDCQPARAAGQGGRVGRTGGVGCDAAGVASRAMRSGPPATSPSKLTARSTSSTSARPTGSTSPGVSGNCTDRSMPRLARSTSRSTPIQASAHLRRSTDPAQGARRRCLGGDSGRHDRHDCYRSQRPAQSRWRRSVDLVLRSVVPRDGDDAAAAHH